MFDRRSNNKLRINIALFESFFVRDHDSSSMNAFCLHHNFGVDKSDIDSFRGWPLPVSSQKPRCRRICDTSLCVASDREEMRYDIKKGLMTTSTILQESLVSVTN